ncbi:rhodanese-like domain-containing protein [Verminephrobacter aporrectodeae subsp. tuberculatae]|uniref:Rhodanese-like domain-containing protein n=1 Tax=Verminephrobacter aporrectodeae subsp. tuberculatae TaxID=1110392 RepID=A0ABT3KS07_9BURK|nr:rhodanese-like domain-containing protein [Verminephrobacter aporrectodeae]MCW5321114.1 rhodanese-like domain-containing protein [Verminephrobacter aporrectodeae subsp. tuberculatae]MCW8199645.1 rhodanese-like domain-containing protein [Verminephrobacter aporrectodeae subsp. tuberculatae]
MKNHAAALTRALILAMAFGPSGNLAWAQPAPAGNELPQALEGIEPASGICRRDESVPGPDQALPAPVAPHGEACAITVREALPLLAKVANGDAAFIDLRPAADYHGFHIEGALNLGSSDLYAKPYWRRKKVVLVDSGKAEHALYRECARLKQAGYEQVHVLHGGMAMWLHQGQSIMGRTPSATQRAQLTHLSPAELWLESQNADHLILLDRSHAAMQSDFGAAHVLERTSPDAIRMLVDKHRKTLPKGSLISILLIADLPDSGVESIQRTLMPIPLLVYGDSREAFARQMATYKAMWVAQARGPKLPGCGL